MGHLIRISTVMLCWNRLELSRQVLQAFLETISVPYELVIANNASTDGTAAWLASIEGDPAITAILHTPVNDPARALNQGLRKCNGELLMVLENDYLLLPGWDLYALECFERLPRLGQLSICPPAPFMVSSRLEGLVKLAKDNVVTSSIFPREIFFNQGLRYATRKVGRSRFPFDSRFSKDVRSLGLLVAWPDRSMAIAVGFDGREFARDPEYYLRHYRARFLDGSWWKRRLYQFARLDFDQFWQVRRRVGILARLYGYKYRRMLDGPWTGIVSRFRRIFST